MRSPWILLLAVAGLTACGDDDPPVPEIEPAREMTEYEKVVASRPRPISLKRERDAATGLSVAFPQGWFLDPDTDVVFHARASELRPEGRYVANVMVSMREAPEMTLDGFLASMEEETAAAHPGLEKLVAGERLLAGRKGRVFRYTVPWKQGRLSHEATILQEGTRFCVILGSCHERERPAFTSTYSIILMSLQWKKPEAPK